MVITHKMKREHVIRSTLLTHRVGTLKDKSLIPKDFTLENRLGNVKGKDKEMFIRFVKKMVHWSPENRATAKELLDDPWLYIDHDKW